MKSDQQRTAVKLIALRAAAVTMGFVFFTGGWRRFFNKPIKLDVDSAHHLANKLVGAAPGSPIEPVIHWVLYHPWISEWSVYLMSAAEIVVGLGLILGLFTRLSALGAALVNVALMLIFGWQGYECLDEWTMAALGFAISVGVMLDGVGAYSLDRYLNWDHFAWLIDRRVAITSLILSLVMTVGFYSYFFGFFDFGKRTSTHGKHIVAQPISGRSDAVTLYVDAGSSGGAAYVKSIVFKLPDDSTVRQGAPDIRVIRSHFMPWSESGMVVDDLLKLRLGSKTDIAVPENARSATLQVVDNPDPTINLASAATNQPS